MCNLSREFKSNLFCFKFSLVTPRDLKQFTYTRDYYYIAYLPTYCWRHTLGSPRVDLTSVYIILKRLWKLLVCAFFFFFFFFFLKGGRHFKVTMKCFFYIFISYLNIFSLLLCFDYWNTYFLKRVYILKCLVSFPTHNQYF